MNGIRTITRRLNSVLNGLSEDMQPLYSIEDFDSKFDVLNRAVGKSDYFSKLSSIYEMFKICGIKYEQGNSDIAYLKKIVKDAGIPATLSDVEEQMLYSLYKKFREYPAPDDFMLRTVNRLCSKEDHWNETDTLRVRILKQFIKYGNYLADAGIKGKWSIQEYVRAKLGKKPSDEEILALIDDSIFTLLETEGKSQRENGTFGLLKVADDLALGKFRAEGGTKRYLYFFAIVYDMTFPDSEACVLDVNTDIETLFRDYYTNNLIRFISDSYQGNLYSYEVNPSGQAINYKNFAEMIFVYYIASAHTSQEKIKLATEMIDRVRTSQFKAKKGESKLTSTRDSTISYIEGMYSEDILKKSELDFEKFLIENYDCDTYLMSYHPKDKDGNEISDKLIDVSVGALQLEQEQNAAYGEYLKILEELTKLGIAIKDCNYGLMLTDDFAVFREKKYDKMCAKWPDIDRDEFDKFIQLMYAVNSFMGYEVDKKETGTDLSDIKAGAMSVSSPKEVSRTSIIIAYYYLYNAYHGDGSHKRQQDFKSLFTDFAKEVDVHLAIAHYQSFSAKNIIDMLIAFSSYVYLNI